MDTCRGFGNVVCNCNFVICTVKYTHTCALGTGLKLVWHNVLDEVVFDKIDEGTLTRPVRPEAQITG